MKTKANVKTIMELAIELAQQNPPTEDLYTKKRDEILFCLGITRNAEGKFVSKSNPMLAGMILITHVESFNYREFVELCNNVFFLLATLVRLKDIQNGVVMQDVTLNSFRIGVGPFSSSDGTPNLRMHGRVVECFSLMLFFLLGQGHGRKIVECQNRDCKQKWFYKTRKRMFCSDRCTRIGSMAEWRSSRVNRLKERDWARERYKKRKKALTKKEKLKKKKAHKV